MAVAKTEHQQGTFKGPVVVLADRDKAEMDAEVALGLQGPAHLEVRQSPTVGEVKDMQAATHLKVPNPPIPSPHVPLRGSPPLHCLACLRKLAQIANLQMQYPFAKSYPTFCYNITMFGH